MLFKIFPFRSQDAHVKQIRTVSIAQLKITDAAFVFESTFFIGTDATRVVLKDRQGDAVQVQFGETIAHHQAHGI